VKQIYRHVLLVITTVIITGMIESCLFHYQGAVKSISLVNSLIVTLIFAFIYSIFIAMGIVLFILTYKKLNKEYNLYTILLSSSMAFHIIYLDYIQKLFAASFINIMIIYIVSTYFLALVVGFIVSKLPRSHRPRP